MCFTSLGVNITHQSVARRKYPCVSQRWGSARVMLINAVDETIAVDLTRSWTNATVSGILSSNPVGMHGSRYPTLYYDSVSNLVRWASGWGYSSDSLSAATNTFVFTPATLSIEWTQDVFLSGEGSKTNLTLPWSPASAFSNKTYFSIRGGNHLAQRWPNMSLKADLITQDLTTGLWNNETMSIPNDSGFRLFSRASYIPNFGQSGIVVVVGGENPSGPDLRYEEGRSMADMSRVVIYDIGTGRWYMQTATGEVPPPRSKFCMVGASTGQTFEMFVYGGAVNQTSDWGAPNHEGYLNVFALSLPGFVWFKSNSSTTVRRAAHTCSLVGNRQMVSIGGYQPSSRQSLGVAQDPWVSGIGIFDLSSFAWTDHYDVEAAPYELPHVIESYYSNHYREPTWEDDSLASMFNFSLTKAPSTPSEAIPSSTAESPSPSSRTSASVGSSTPLGPIVGGTVGGVVLLVIVAVTICLRKKYKGGSSERISRNSQERRSQRVILEKEARMDGDIRYEAGGEAKAHLVVHELDAGCQREPIFVAEIGEPEEASLRRR